MLADLTILLRAIVQMAYLCGKIDQTYELSGDKTKNSPEAQEMLKAIRSAANCAEIDAILKKEVSDDAERKGKVTGK